MKALRMIILSVVTGTVLLVTPLSYAYDVNQEFCANGGAGTELCQSGTTATNPIVGPEGVLTKVVNFFSIITGIVAVIVIILMGLRFVTSNGDAGKAASARQGIIYAVAGLIVAALAQAMVLLVLSKM